MRSYKSYFVPTSCPFKKQKVDLLTLGLYSSWVERCNHASKLFTPRLGNYAPSRPKLEFGVVDHARCGPGDHHRSCTGEAVVDELRF